MIHVDNWLENAVRCQVLIPISREQARQTDQGELKMRSNYKSSVFVASQKSQCELTKR